MEIQHPTASLIARRDRAGRHHGRRHTNVLLSGELLAQAERYISEGLRPRIVADGFELAKKKALDVLDATRSRTWTARRCAPSRVPRCAPRCTPLADVLTSRSSTPC